MNENKDMINKLFDVSDDEILEVIDFVIDNFKEANNLDEFIKSIHLHDYNKLALVGFIIHKLLDIDTDIKESSVEVEIDSEPSKRSKFKKFIGLK